MPRTVLVADDSLIIQKVIRLALKDQDVEVISVATGTEAIEQIERAPPAIVLADTRMPGQTGYEVGEFVKAAPELCEIPVVLMAGAFEPVDDTRARAVSDAILVKPFEPDRLVATVCELLSHRPTTSKAAPVSRVREDGRAPAPPGPTPGASGAARLTADAAPAQTAVHAAASTARGPQPPELPVTRQDASDDEIDRLATRVIAKLSDRVIRETTTQIVNQVAERVVREEIERLKEKLR